jgi:N6-adenosine-specific RNA methylase IME4
MKYQIIYADPPWRQTKGGKRMCRPNQGTSLDYNTLSLSDIREIIDSVEKEEVHTLFLWTIDKYLHEAEQLFGDYKLHARFIWDKGNGVAPAFTVRYSHEYLLWLYKPKMIPIEPSQRGKYTTILRERSTVHSRKPAVARHMIESLYPNKPRIELFAREKTRGWDVWGDEVESDINII